jgi:hypothetical protein
VKIVTQTQLQFSNSTELKRWLETQTINILAPVQAQAKKLKEDMNTALKAVEDMSRFLFDVSSKEIEKRNMKLYNRARALNKLARLFLDRLRKINAPEQTTYESINRYLQECQKIIFVTDIDIKNWFPRISPFFIMDRRKFLAVHERAKQAHIALNDFVNKDYIKIKTLEETTQLVNELQTLETQLVCLKDDKENIKNQRISIEHEIAELEQKIIELKSKGPIDKLNLVNTEIESLSNELKHMIRHLQKPFIKMSALATMGGGGGITPDELKKINQYLDSPFDGLTSEQSAYPFLKEILRKLENLIARDELKLKPEKQRKAEQTIREILNSDCLAKLQIRCLEMAINREQLLASSKMDEMKKNIAQYQQQVDQIKARKASIETHETVKENASNETADKINNLKRTIEKNISNSIEQKIQIT